MNQSSVNRSVPTGTPEIEIAVPASSEYLTVLRTVAAGLAARLDFTLDDIEDLRIAVDEACAVLLGQADAGTDLTCRFDLVDGAVMVTVSVRSARAQAPGRDTYSWTVLSALTSSTEVVVDPPSVSITLVQNPAKDDSA